MKLDKSSSGDDIVISAHHYMLKDTTVASGEWEGVAKSEDGEVTDIANVLYERVHAARAAKQAAAEAKTTNENTPEA